MVMTGSAKYHAPTITEVHPKALRSVTVNGSADNRAATQAQIEILIGGYPSSDSDRRHPHVSEMSATCISGEVSPDTSRKGSVKNHKFLTKSDSEVSSRNTLNTELEGGQYVTMERLVPSFQIDTGYETRLYENLRDTESRHTVLEQH